MYISEERIKEVISHIKAGFNNIPQRERNLSAEGINYLLDKIEEKMLGDESKIQRIKKKIDNILNQITVEEIERRIKEDEENPCTNEIIFNKED